MSVTAVARASFDASNLVHEHPPVFHNDRKRMLYERISMPIGGTLQVSRWQGELPATFKLPPRPRLVMQEDIFSYPEEESGTTTWHLNFADAELFGYYSGPLLAQDEHQVLEHPILGSLREALVRLQHTQPELAPRTRGRGPTPYLIKGAQRSICFDTVTGPYGNAFASSSPERVLSAAVFLNPPTFSNILAMEAPRPGFGAYSREEIRDVLETAFIGFSASKVESGSLQGVVHTGNWGCGAYGGNPVLMALLQLIAAQLAGLDCLVYHTVSAQGSEAYRVAAELCDGLLLTSTFDTGEFIEQVHSMRFEWGQSDGN